MEIKNIILHPFNPIAENLQKDSKIPDMKAYQQRLTKPHKDYLIRISLKIRLLRGVQPKNGILVS